MASPGSKVLETRTPSPTSTNARDSASHDLEAADAAIGEKKDDPAHVNETSTNTSSNEPSKKEIAEDGEPRDPNLEVWWEEPENEDPENPMNWSEKKKWMNIMNMSLITFLAPLASSMFAPGIPKVMEDFNTDSSTFATFVVSIFVLGFAVGPLILAPLSEIYGRVIVYHVTNVIFLITTVCCAVSNSPGMLLAFRFLGGFAGVSTVICGSGTISDMMPRERRGLAMSLWSIGPLLGPIVGPISGGYLISALNWRWVFWVIAICFAAVTALAFVVMRESYALVLLERKAARLRKETGLAYYSRLTSPLPFKAMVLQNITRPMKMLFLSPIVAIMCCYIAIMYGCLYLLFTTFTFVFEDQYGFSTSAAGLSFIGSGIGTFAGLGWVATLSDGTLKKRAAGGKIITPEDRLPLIITLPASIALPAGLFIYGWSSEYKVHWIVPQIGTAILSFGMICLFMVIQTYLVDAFTAHAASVTAANAVIRSLLGALLPLCGLQLYEALGYGWGNSLLAFIVLSLAPCPILLGFYGAKIREHPRFQAKF